MSTSIRKTPFQHTGHWLFSHGWIVAFISGSALHALSAWEQNDKATYMENQK